jgi:hypothetical protein
MWKGLVPLLVGEQEQHLSTTKMKRVALKVLIQHFNDHIRQIEMDHAVKKDEENHYKNNAWMVAHFQLIADNDCSDFIPADTMSNKKSTQPHLSVIILPPNPLYKGITYSRIPSTSPASLFSGRLIYNENTLIRLTSLSAYISTMGGGFFLCRYLSTAVSMARQQCRIALLRGDEEMAFKCRINEGYCYIHAGKLNRGKKIIKCVLIDVTKRQKQTTGIDWEVSLEHHDESELAHTSDRELSELTVIRNMCTSALRFANLIKQQRLEEAAAARDETQNKKLSATHDDFQRIRVVKDRVWKR